MHFLNEKELQNYMAEVMASKGVKVELEVTTHNGRRIDLVTSRYAIECKPTLTRAALLQAAAQMKLYARSFPNHEYILAGLSPKSVNGYKAAHSAAVDIKKEFGYTVWFIDRMSYFAESEEEEDEYKPCTPANLIDDVYGLKQQRTDVDPLMKTDREQKKSEVKVEPQAKGQSITTSGRYEEVAFQILRYGFAFCLSCVLIEGIYNRIKNDDRNYWGTVVGIGLVYAVLKYPFRSSEEK